MAHRPQGLPIATSINLDFDFHQRFASSSPEIQSSSSRYFSNQDSSSLFKHLSFVCPFSLSQMTMLSSLFVSVSGEQSEPDVPGFLQLARRFSGRHVEGDKLTVLAAAVALSVGLSACGGGSSSTTMPEEPTPTAYGVAVAAIAAAGTAAEAEAAYDAAKADVTAAQGEKLRAAVDMRIAAIEMVARADVQKMALADAAGMIDTSDLIDADAIADANAAIAALKMAWRPRPT